MIEATPKIKSRDRLGRILAQSCLLLWLIALPGASQSLSTNWSLTNKPPIISIAFPPDDIFIRFGIDLQVRAVANDPEGSISEVQLFDEFVTGNSTGTNLLATKLLPPYSGVLPGVDEGLHVLRAVAIDNFGVASTSAPVKIKASQPPTRPAFLITEPSHLSTLAASVPFHLSTTMLETDGFDQPIELLVGTNVVATFTEPPYSTIISNLSVGEYDLCARAQTNATYRRQSICLGAHITVVPLLLSETALAPNRGFQFDVAGNLAGQTNVVEASTNLVNWQLIGTNVATTNSFFFLDTEATNFNRRFYRALLKP